MDSDLDWSDSDRSEGNSRHTGSSFVSASSLALPTFYNSHHLLTRDESIGLLPLTSPALSL